MANMRDQPTAPRPTLAFCEYPSSAGKALSITLDIREMGRFYRPHRDDLCTRFNVRGWSARRGTPYIPHDIHGLGDALNVLRESEFPATLRAEARRGARTLADAFAPRETEVSLRDLRAGRMDQRKLSQLARTLESDGDLERVRPYRRTEAQPNTPPRIAIISSAGWGEMWKDSGYIPRILTLTLAVQWACETAGIQATSALALAAYHPQSHARVQLGIMLARPHQRTPLSAYLVALHSDLWRWSFMSACAAEAQGYATLGAVEGRAPHENYVGAEYSSLNGGRAVEWARATLRPDMVISIGDNSDAYSADIRIKSSFSVAEACAEIGRQARARGWG